jgi:flagellar biosynthesis/type III secretory pathway chaperone
MAKKTVDEEILNIIKKNIPTMESESLKNIFKEHEEMLKYKIESSKDREDLIKQKLELFNEVKSLKETIRNLESRVRRAEDLDEIQKRLDRKESDLALERLRIELNASNKINENTFNLVNTLFKNPSKISSISSNVPVVLQSTDYNGHVTQFAQDHYINKSITEEIL